MCRPKRRHSHQALLDNSLKKRFVNEGEIFFNSKTNYLIDFRKRRKEVLVLTKSSSSSREDLWRIILLVRQLQVRSVCLPYQISLSLLFCWCVGWWWCKLIGKMDWQYQYLHSLFLSSFQFVCVCVSVNWTDGLSAPVFISPTLQCVCMCFGVRSGPVFPSPLFSWCVCVCQLVGHTDCQDLYISLSLSFSVGVCVCVCVSVSWTDSQHLYVSLSVCRTCGLSASQPPCGWGAV
jgi:hypothetical protein